jgi:hypothetical protein
MEIPQRYVDFHNKNTLFPRCELLIIFLTFGHSVHTFAIKISVGFPQCTCNLLLIQDEIVLLLHILKFQCKNIVVNAVSSLVFRVDTFNMIIHLKEWKV